MRVIPLTMGLMAYVDDEDFERVSKYNWRAAWTGKTRRIYAVRTCSKIEGGGKRRTVYMHNFILGHKNIDHRSGNSLDNQKENLRQCNKVQNGHNRKIQNHSSRFKGVSLFKPTGKYQARGSLNGQNVHLGYFDKEEDAARVYDEYAIKHYGEFAKTNHEMGVFLAL